MICCMKPSSFKSILLALTIAICFSGCGLLPKKVEFFQDKVKAVPEKTEATQEHERQAAQYVASEIKKTSEAVNGLNITNPAVTIPLENANTVAPALSLSLGPPVHAWPTNRTDASEVLASTLTTELARLNKKIDDYRNDVEKNVGKKIEGSGAFQIGYFSYVALIGGLFAAVFVVLKIIASVNPPVAVGMKVAQMGGKFVAKGFSELVDAGEHFKDMVAESTAATFTKEEIIKLFSTAHAAKQSRDTQDVIKSLTN